jgi:hypothetical protein
MALRMFRSHRAGLHSSVESDSVAAEGQPWVVHRRNVLRMGGLAAAGAAGAAIVSSATATPAAASPDSSVINVLDYGVATDPSLPGSYDTGILASNNSGFADAWAAARAAGGTLLIPPGNYPISCDVLATDDNDAGIEGENFHSVLFQVGPGTCISQSLTAAGSLDPATAQPPITGVVLDGRFADDGAVGLRVGPALAGYWNVRARRYNGTSGANPVSGIRGSIGFLLQNTNGENGRQVSEACTWGPGCRLTECHYGLVVDRRDSHWSAGYQNFQHLQWRNCDTGILITNGAWLYAATARFEGVVATTAALSGVTDVIGISIVDTPVVTSVSADTFTKTNHRFSNGDAVQFAADTIIGTTGISANTTYYVVNASADTFQVSTTPGGSAVNLTGADGSVQLHDPFYNTSDPRPGSRLTGQIKYNFEQNDTSPFWVSSCAPINIDNTSMWKSNGAIDCLTACPELPICTISGVFTNEGPTYISPTPTQDAWRSHQSFDGDINTPLVRTSGSANNPSSFTTKGDARSRFKAGTLVRWRELGRGYVYGRVTSATYDGTSLTTVNLQASATNYMGDDPLRGSMLFFLPLPPDVPTEFQPLAPGTTICTANTVRTNTAALVTPTGMAALSIVNGVTYRVRVRGYFTVPNNSTAGIKLALTAGSGAAVSAMALQWTFINGGAGGGNVSGTTTALGNIYNNNGTPINTTLLLVADGFITASHDGTITLQFAESTATASTTVTCLAGSHMEIDIAGP